MFSQFRQSAGHGSRRRVTLTIGRPIEVLKEMFMQGPDFSDYVVHFTKDAHPFLEATPDEKWQGVKSLSAKERLFSILQSGQIWATRMPWTNKPAVCFTECTWGSLLFHATRYSKFGVGFHKAFLFAAGGGPAIYLTPGLWKHQENYIGREKPPFDPNLYSFITPFMPSYAPQKYREDFWRGKDPVDYSHEREWRVPHELVFELDKVAFVIVATYKDMAEAPKPLKDAIGRENWLIMANYEKIEKFWPLHRLPPK